MATFSLVFNGTNSTANNGDATVLDNPSDFSASLWYKSSSATNQTFIVKANQTGGGSDGWAFLAISGSDVELDLKSVDRHIFTATNSFPTIQDGNWHQLGFTKASDDTVIIYVDGVAQASTDTVNLPLTSLHNTFASYYGSDRLNQMTITGQMTLMYTYSRVLSSAEMAVLAAGGTPSSTSLVSFYPCTEGSGTTVADSNSVANLTLSNVTWSSDVPVFGASAKVKASANLVF